MSAGEAPFEVEEWEDEALILPLLERDRRWSAYALSDLDPPYRENARILGARDAAGPIGLLLLYALPGTTALLPFGSPAGVRAILARTETLPRSVFYITANEHLPVLATVYALESRMPMSRMTLSAAEYVSPQPSTPAPERLVEGDEQAIADLYSHWGPTFFDPLMLHAGIYYGVRDAGRLIAVAGTHVVSPRHRVAAIGGVFTHPDYRGRGLATSTTGAVARDLVERGIDLIVLNVREDNAPAVAAYTRLGFRPYLTFTEGQASLR